MTRAEIKNDPWQARDTVADELRSLANSLNDMWISEDSMEEDPEYRKSVIGAIAANAKLVEKIKEQLKEIPC